MSSEGSDILCLPGEHFDKAFSLLPDFRVETPQRVLLQSVKTQFTLRAVFHQSLFCLLSYVDYLYKYQSINNNQWSFLSRSCTHLCPGLALFGHIITNDLERPVNVLQCQPHPLFRCGTRLIDI